MEKYTLAMNMSVYKRNSNELFSLIVRPMLFVTLATIMILIIIVVVAASYKEEEGSLIDSGTSTLSSISSSLINSLNVGDYSEVRRLLGGVAKDKRVSAIALVDSGLHLDYTYPDGESLFKKVTSEDILREIDKATKSNARDYVVKNGNHLIFYKLVYDEKATKIWHLIVDYSLTALKYQLLQKSLVLVVIVLILVSFSYVIFSKLLLRKLKPLSEVIVQIGQVSKGNYSLPDIQPPKVLQLRSLVAAFNEMKTNLYDLRIKDKEQTEILKEQSRLVSIGQSAAMIAHDVRKPLTSMKALLSSLPFIQNDPAQMEKMIATVDRNIFQTNTMLNDVLEFSRDSTALELKEHSPQEIITSALGDAFRNHPNIDVKIEYDFKHTHCLNVDGARIIRVLTNIIDNALDAMKPDNSGKIKGTLNFTTCERNKDGKDLVEIKVSDDGTGIPEEVIAKIFDPFFTKGKRSGTGLGLAICRRIIDLHGGKIGARNRDGDKGAEFSIGLFAGPTVASINESELIRHSNELKKFREEEATRIDYGDSSNMAEFMRINKERGRKSYLLMVDDEPLFRESVRCLLNDLGQAKDHVKFIEADCAENAMEILKAREFDYAIVDIDMGKRKMNGYEFARLLLKRHQNIRVIIHSNKRKEEMDKDIRQISNERFMGFLPKPMTSSELLQFLACKTFEVATKVNAKGTTKKKILVVNDDDCLLVSFKFMLNSPEVQVLTATNVSDAIKHTASHKMDLILSDINLGQDEPSGYDFLKHVRDTDKQTPFYFVSSYSAKAEGPKAKTLGATGYLQLPVDSDQINGLL